jgi:hypothetical protein
MMAQTVLFLRVYVDSVVVLSKVCLKFQERNLTINEALVTLRNARHNPTQTSFTLSEIEGTQQFKGLPLEINIKTRSTMSDEILEARLRYVEV